MSYNQGYQQQQSPQGQYQPQQQQQQYQQQPQQQQLQGYNQQQGQQQQIQVQQQGYPQQQGFQQNQQQQGVQMVQYQNQQQPQVVVIVQGGGGMMNFGDILATLDKLPAVYIKQQYEWLEAVFGIETPNVYLVLPANNQGYVMNNMPPVLRFKERSSYCARQCLTGDCRPYSLVGHDYRGMITQSMQSYYNDQNMVIRMDRPCAYTFYCCNRPFIDIFDTQNGQQRFLGKIVSPYQCCDHGVEIFDQNNILIYIIEASCCQTIFWINCPCESCQKCKFIIYGPNRQFLAELWKETQGCFQAMGDQGDNFRVIFPPNTIKEHKALIMAAALFLDYRFFEKQQQQQDVSIGGVSVDF